ncbi:UNVERIFIED_CONTAM: F-box/LRR-repeat protein [Sesamum indicum]
MSQGGGNQVRLSCDDDPNIGYIEGIMATILSKLPVTSVLKFKVVSKFWNKLIRNQQFAQLQFSSFPKTPKLILYVCGNNSGGRSKLYLMERSGRLSKPYVMDRSGRIRPYLTFPNLDRSSSLQLISCFNGLLCCTKSVGTEDLDIQICNPATREVLEVPKGSPCAETPSIGVVFDPDTNKYQILRFVSAASGSEVSTCKCEIYTPEGGDWRSIPDVVQGPVANPACPSFPTHACAGGRMYWLVWSKEDREVPDYILSIDMNNTITRVELPGGPDDPDEFNIFTFLVDYEGRLALVCVDDDETYVDIWSLIDPSESTWVLEGCAELQIDGFLEGINSIVSVENELLFIMKPGFGTSFGFHFLNLADWTWRTPIRRRFRMGSSEPVAFRYTESLLRCAVKIDVGEWLMGLGRLEEDVGLELLIFGLRWRSDSKSERFGFA